MTSILAGFESEEDNGLRRAVKYEGRTGVSLRREARLVIFIFHISQQGITGSPDPR
jgi:hypothetical protein